MARIEELLEQGLELGIQKPGKERSAVAVSANGAMYLGSEVSTSTNILNIPAEQVALLRAVQVGDFAVTQMYAYDMRQSGPASIDPITIKILLDYMRRSARPLSYELLMDGSAGLEAALVMPNVINSLPEYQDVLETSLHLLRPMSQGRLHANYSRLGGVPTKQLMKVLAKDGLPRAFTTYDGASAYGAVALSADGYAATSGQYSSFEGRTNIHAEVGAIITLLMEGHKDISAVAVISEKKRYDLCFPCGCCRQFMSEVVSKLGQDDIAVTCCSLEEGESRTFFVRELLPYSWDNSRG